MIKKRTKKDHKIQQSDDPAFLLYFRSWLARTGLMSKSVKSDWIDLMCYQAVKGALTIDEIKNVCGSDFETNWKIISEFFTEKNGTFFDKKLRKVLTDRKSYCESRRRNAMGNKGLEEKHMLSVCAAYFLIYARNKNRNRNNSFDLSFSFSEKDKSNFLETFKSFCEMRAGINRKITKKGMELLLKKLASATPDISLQIKILEHSIHTSTPDIYPETVLKKFGNLPFLHERLKIYLPEDSIAKILDLCPNLTLDYLNRKIELMQTKRPSDPESYLYNAITKDYSPEANSTDSKPSQPLAETEYSALSEEMKAKLKPEEHIVPAKKVWVCTGKPERDLMPYEKIPAKGMEKGIEIEDRFYQKIPDTLKGFYTLTNIPMQKKIMYHWM